MVISQLWFTIASAFRFPLPCLALGAEKSFVGGDKRSSVLVYIVRLRRKGRKLRHQGLGHVWLEGLGRTEYAVLISAAVLGRILQVGLMSSEQDSWGTRHLVSNSHVV